MLRWLYFSFDGRIGRAIYWWGTLALFLLTMVIVNTILAQAGFYQIDISNKAEFERVLTEAGPALDLAGLVILWPSLALHIKRWHDRDKSGWWVLIGFIPVIGGLWMLIELGFLRGSDGANRFGPDPVRR